MLFYIVIEIVLLIFISTVQLEVIEYKNFECIDNHCTLRNISSTSQLTEVLKNLTSFKSNAQVYYDYGFSQKIIELDVFKKLTCNDTKLEKIPPLVFEKFSDLEIFEALHVGLKEVNSNDFEHAGHLEFLNLSNNKITKLENKVFVFLEFISKIDLSRNEISWIDVSAFEGLKSLMHLDLSFNKVTVIHEEFFMICSNYSGFLSIDFANNQINEIVKYNTTSEKLHSLIGLNLMNNNLKEVDLKFIELHELNLVNNLIEKLDVNGSVLYLKNNNLRELSLSSALCRVEAESNKITVLKSGEITSRLEAVLLSGNNLGNEIFKELQNSTNLSVLDVSNNSITSLSVGSLAEFEVLLTLRLDRNDIEFIDYGFFSHQKKLEVLNISYNAISEIDFHVFASMTFLREIDVSGNNISKIEGFENIRNILPILQSIGLEGNNWDCEYLSRLKVSMTSQNITVLKPAKPVKNSPSVAGIGCVVNIKADKQSDDKTNEKIIALMQQINEQNTKIENQKFMIEKLSTNIKVEDLRKNEKSFGFTFKVLIIAIIFMAAVFIVLGVKKAKNCLNSNNQQRLSRDPLTLSFNQSLNTIPSFDNSSL